MALPLRTARLAPPLPYATPLPTGAAQLDAALGGGVARGELTEVFGAAGSGKSSFVRALARSAAATLIVDADGSVHAPALGPHTHVLRVTSWSQLAACVAHLLPGMVAAIEGVELVAVDSVAFLFRSCVEDAAQKRLEAFALRMAALAARFDVAVVLVNHTKGGKEGVRSTRAHAAEVGISALGEAWEHVCATRVGLGWSEQRHGDRVAVVVKSPRVPRASVPFEITQHGLGNVTDG